MSGAGLSMVDRALTPDGWAEIRRSLPMLPIDPPRNREELKTLWRDTLPQRRPPAALALKSKGVRT